jgi:hypothetical protein
MSTTTTGIRIIDMPDLGSVSDSSSFVGEHAGSGRFSAPALATYINGAGGVYNVKSYGATGNGSTDDTAAVSAAIAACPNGGQVYFPPGYYNVNATLQLNEEITVRGAGRFVTVIRSTNATGHIFNCTGPVEICDLGFNASVTRTGGAYVSFGASSSRSRMSRFFMLAAYIGINVDPASGGDVAIMDGEILNWTSDANAGAVVIAGQEVTSIAHCYFQQGSRPGVGFGIKLLNGGGVFQDVDIADAGIGLVLAPASGQTLASAWFDNCFFDNCQVGVQINPSGTGVVRRSRFANCWMSSCTNQGVIITSPSVSSVDGIDFSNCHILGNAADGVLFQDANSRNISFANCQIAGNANSGINLYAGGTAFSVVGCRIGPWGGFAANAAGAMNLGAACAQYRIVDNDLSGNGGATLQGAGVQTGTSPGHNEYISSNIGYADSAAGTVNIGAAATSIVVNHGLAGAPPVYRILLTATTGLGTAGSFFVSAVTATTFTISLAAAPGATISLSWQARMACSV